MSNELGKLDRQHWVNNHTRAVFLEFSVYNPQVPLEWACSLDCSIACSDITSAAYIPRLTYLPSASLWQSSSLVEECKHHGGLSPSGSFMTLMALERCPWQVWNSVCVCTRWECDILQACGAILTGLGFCYLLCELRKMKNLKARYFRSGWILVDWGILVAVGFSQEVRKYYSWRTNQFFSGWNCLALLHQKNHRKWTVVRHILADQRKWIYESSGV